MMANDLERIRQQHYEDRGADGGEGQPMDPNDHVPATEPMPKCPPHHSRECRLHCCACGKEWKCNILFDESKIPIGIIPGDGWCDRCSSGPETMYIVGYGMLTDLFDFEMGG